MAPKQVHLVVRGNVHSVCFRTSARREARRLGLAGYVCNRKDGTVELTAEGEEEPLREIINWAHHGPADARVEGVEVNWRSYTGQFEDFRTRNSAPPPSVESTGD